MVKLALLAAACLVLVASSECSMKFGRRDWNLFKRQHGKTYESSEIEMLRKDIFLKNKEIIDKFNAEQSEKLGYRLSLNHLADLTEEERSKLNGVKLGGEHTLHNTPEAQAFLESILNDDSIEVPDEVDWRKTPGRVSSVKNQGQCGSCWAFSTVGVLEGQEAVRNKSLLAGGEIVSLSPQNLVDCDTKGDDQGCNGGFMTNALNFIKAEGGIDSEKAYPYEGFDDDCKFKKAAVAMTDSGAAVLPSGDEQKLKETVAKFGPVAVAVDAEMAFQFYGGGVLYDITCSNQLNGLNHGVLVVGYGTDAKQGDYWIIKNSWGDAWGEKGYIRVARNKKNMCGVATVPIIPTF